MLGLASQIAEATDWIHRRWSRRPRVGIILGTGLGHFANEVQPEAVFDYQDIPHFPRATALGHKGQLVCGSVAGLPVVTMEGRYHLYEGYRLDQITLPVRVMKALGIDLLIISNASGGLNPHYRAGDIMVIDDHINLMFDNPLIGINDDNLGPRFPDMSAPYDPALIDRALRIARQGNVVAHRGVYVALSGPNYETRAEYRFLRRIGGDVVGMSTAPEAIVAAHAGLRVVALSVVTNVCSADVVAKTDGEAVIRAAQSAESSMRTIVRGILAEEGSSSAPQQRT